MLKEFMLRQMMKSKLKELPEGERERLIAVILKDPALFEEIAKKMQARINEGEEQMSAAMAVFREHEGEIKKLLEEK